MRSEEKLIVEIHYKSSKSNVSRWRSLESNLRRTTQRKIKLEYSIPEAGIPMLRCDDKHGCQSSTLNIHEKSIYRKQWSWPRKRYAVDPCQSEIIATKEIHSGSMSQNQWRISKGKSKITDPSQVPMWVVLSNRNLGNNIRRGWHYYVPKVLKSTVLVRVYSMQIDV